MQYILNFLLSGNKLNIEDFGKVSKSILTFNSIAKLRKKCRQIISGNW